MVNHAKEYTCTNTQMSISQMRLSQLGENSAEVIAPHHGPDKSLINLPTELLVNIVNHLPLSSQVLLSLSCKRLRIVLTNGLDLPFTNEEEKLIFLTLLERDLPEYLTCRECLRMFLWRRRASNHYTCPNKSIDQLPTHGLSRTHCYTHNVRMNREVIDLILRAHCYGKQYGLAASYLNHECQRSDMLSGRIFQYNKGGFVNGHFYFIKTLVYITENIAPFKASCHGFLMPICMHHSDTLFCRLLTARKHWNAQQPPLVETVKCKFCATDCKAVLMPRDLCGPERIEMTIWQKFGRNNPYQDDVRYFFECDLMDPNTRNRSIEEDLKDAGDLSASRIAIADSSLHFA